MKKIIFPIIIVVFLTFVSCSAGGKTMLFKPKNNEDVANFTFNEITNAINEQNSNRIISLFVNTIKNEYDLSFATLELIEYIDGEIISTTSAIEAGIGTHCETSVGKRKEIIQSSFCVETSNAKYYFAIRECVRDDFNNNNEGVLSIYVIESSIWTQDYIFRGNGESKQGIVIFSTGGG